MNNKKRLLYCALVAVVLLAGLAIYNRCSSKAEVVKVERDTVVIRDTVPYYHPTPKDSAIVKYVTRYLPVVKSDTIFRENSVMEHFADSSNMMPVVIPITTKHYRAMEYDAWVSGYEPSLDSIKVYQRTEYVTETVTLSKPPNRFSIGLQGGYGYGFKSKQWEPYVGIGIGIKIF